MPRRGYTQTPEHRAKRAAAIAAAMTGRRHTAETKRLIGEGVRRAARARRWWESPASPRDFLVSLAFSHLTYLWAGGQDSPVGGFPPREVFERLPRSQQDRFLKRIVRVVDWSPDYEIHEMDVEFWDGSRWQARPRDVIPRTDA